MDILNQKMRVCKNKCIFCFVDQHPSGLRRPLYIKDDDFRYSFVYGNYITLTNLNDKDYRYIKKYRISPLYISVHTLDDNLRRYMLGNKNAPSIIKSLRTLEKNNIKIHTQIVLCRDINDGQNLLDTLVGLNSFKNILSLAIVPVGLTKYHKNNLKKIDKKTAISVFNIAENFEKTVDKKNYPVYLSDEFYLSAGREIPEYSFYKDFCQIENGVGMIAQLRMNLKRLLRYFAGLKSSQKVLILTSKIMEKEMKKCIDILNKLCRINFDIYAVENNFYGKTVTVSGLLVGKSFINIIKKVYKKYNYIFIPSNAVNNDNLFIDDVSYDILKNDYPNVYKAENFSDVYRILRRGKGYEGSREE